MNNIVEASPDERHLALTAPARHIAFHQRIAERAAALAYVAPPPREPEISEADFLTIYDALVADLTAALAEFIPPLPAKPLWFNVEDISPPRLSSWQIQEIVGRHYGVSVAAIISGRRTKDLITPRHVAICLCREFTQLSLAHIGRRFGGMDHSSILHALHKIPRRMQYEPDLFQAVNKLRSEIGSLS